MFLKNPAVLSGKKYTSKEKKSTKFILKQILNTIFGVFLKIDTRSHGLDKQSALDMQIQTAKRNKNTSSRHSPFYKGTILLVKPSRQKCFVVNSKENWREFSVLDTSDFLSCAYLISNKNALSSGASRLLGDEFCCQRPRCCYTTFSFGIQSICLVVYKVAA